jgi:peptide/nickel transport system substrate-binding protein
MYPFPYDILNASSIEAQWSALSRTGHRDISQQYGGGPMTRKGIFFCVVMMLFIGSFPDFGQGAQAKEEVLKIAVSTEPASLDTSLYGSSADTIVVSNWGEHLLNKATSGEITPGLLASWKMAPDGKKMECTLRKGVRFHSGDLLTTKDVLFSYERGITKNVQTKSNLTSVERLEIIDDYRFTFHFKVPDVVFIPRQCSIPIVSKSYHERVGEDVFTRQPSGTGPYKVVGYRPGEYVDIERFEEYWGKKPPVKKARIYFVSEDTTRVAKLKAGEVDFIRSIPFTEVKPLEKSPDFKVVKLNTNAPTAGVTFGSKNPKMPWYDKRVRLAMALAIDCQSIIHNLLQDQAIHLTALAPGELGYDPEVKPYPYDPKRAKALLAEAGYPNGFDIRMTYAMGARVAMAQEVVEAVASYFEAVGIRTKLVGEEQATMVINRKKTLDPKAEYIAYWTAGFAGGVDPTHTLTRWMTTGGGAPLWSHPEVDKMVAEARATIDDKKRAELIKKAVRIIHEEVASIPILTNVCYFGMKKNVHFTPTKKESTDIVLVKDITVK